MTVPGSHRQTARVILRRGNGDIFLLLTHFDPEVGLPPRWITPGGGIEPGESISQAAIRELAEETGIVIDEASLGELVGKSHGRWHWADGSNWHDYTDHFFEYIVDDFVLDASQWTEDEKRDVLEYRWWAIQELESTNELLGPPNLPNVIVRR
ncbi:MAG: hypothetical protein RIS26_757 [Actinomycetota bacterium]